MHFLEILFGVAVIVLLDFIYTEAKRIRKNLETPAPALTLDDVNTIRDSSTCDYKGGLTPPSKWPRPIYVPDKLTTVAASERKDFGSMPQSVELYLQRVLNRVKGERHNQWAKWGKQERTPSEWIVIMSEELGEASKEVFDYHLSGVNAKTYQDLRTELIQLAAVAVQAVEDLDRQYADTTTEVRTPLA